MAEPGGLFGGGGIAAQFLLWGVGYGIAQAILAPEFAVVSQDMWQALPELVISPADLADMVVKSIFPEEVAALEAERSGVNTSRFHAMVRQTGEPPGLETVLEMWRRGIIPWDTGNIDEASVTTAILTSRIKNIWTEAIQKVAEIPLSPADAVEAVLKGQIPQADGQAEAGFSGINPDRFQVLLDTAGNPPSPAELIELLRRKLIPLEGLGPKAVSFQSGIYEGRTRNEWWPLYAKLAVYVPPPRSIATLQSHGVISEAEANQLYQDAGLTPELAATYAKSAVATRVSAHTQLTEANVLKLYYDRLVDAAGAEKMLADLGIGADVAKYLLELQDFNRAAAAYNAAVSRVGTLYVGHHIGRDDAVQALTRLDVPDAARQHLIATWDQEQALNIKPVSAATITAAFADNIITQAQAMTKLEAIGFAPYDAWLELSVKVKQKLPGEPAFAGSGSGPAPVA